ncbi:MAG: prephenate dehydrogenase [Acidobacteriaceae bacterium]
MPESIQSIAILGTGLIGSSVGLALRDNGFAGSIVGWDRAPEEAEIAREKGVIDSVAADPLAAARASDAILLATPVFGILEWIERLAPVLQQHQLVTDVGSTKRKICALAAEAFSSRGAAYFLPGHPMAGKEVFGAANADANLFQGAVWLFTSPEPNPDEAKNPTLGRQRADKWRHWVARMGCRMLDLDPVRHDEICAWASHLPQLLGTALAALLEDTFPEDGKEKGNLDSASAQLRAIGGRAMHEMTRLGASPYSMWRDIAQTNDEAIAAALLALDQRLASIRENLKQPELREEFLRANRFRSRF